MIRASALVAGWLILFTTTARAGTAIVAASADAELRSFDPDTNHGAGTTVISGKLGIGAGGEVRRAVIAFDLVDTVPPGSVVSAATVTVNVVMQPQVPPDTTFQLRRVLKSWAQSTVTWNAPWDASGASGAADVSGTVSSSVLVSGLGLRTFNSTPQLVADVQAWVNDPESNFGWLLISQDEVSLRTARHFGASENPGAAAVLTIEYTASEPPPSAPLISNARLVGTDVGFEFAAEAGRTYSVEFAGDIAGGWAVLTNVPAPIMATTIEVLDPLTTSNRFYRVRTP
jgi:hypothetical protein